MIRRIGLALLVVLVMDSAHRTQAAENWPQWRGPQSTGVAAEGDYPVEFSADSGVAWKVELPGLGMSTPVVWGERIVLTCGIDGNDGVCAYDMSGRPLWQKQFGPERAGKNRNGSGSNPSPVTDGEHIVVYYKSGTLACLDFEGQVAWQKNLQDEYGADTLWWDLASSPVLAGDRVIVAVMHAGESFLAALALSDGKVLWKTPRQYKRPAESDQSYTTPQLVSLAGRDVAVTLGADHLTAHDVATGELIWDIADFNPDNQPMWRVIASPVVASEIVLVPFGRGDSLSAYRLGPPPVKLWEKQGKGLGPDVPTPVIAEGRAFVLTDSGGMRCFHLESGDEIWADELPRSRNKFYASPLLAGGKLYCAREDGVVFVIAADEFKILATNKMGEKLIASPVPMRGGLLIRGEKHLIRVEGATQAQLGPAG